MTQIKLNNNVLQVYFNKRKVFESSPKNPGFFAGRGNETIQMYRGNFKISDHLKQRIGLTCIGIAKNQNINEITFSDPKEEYKIKVSIHEVNDRIVFNFENLNSNIEDKTSSHLRYWFRFPAQKDEHVYGCGEQFSYLNLRGKHFPLWTGEQGVGRNKKKCITWLADINDKAGGDYYTTFYPQPTFVSDKNYFVHVDTYSYADFDFRNIHFHEVQTWELPKSIIISVKDTIRETVGDVSAFLGRMTKIPDWCHNGVILGIQGGTKVCDEQLNLMKKSNTSVAGIWAQDWEGVKVTSFGKRLHWNWIADEKLYPRLQDKIQEWNKQGVKFTGYINPYVLKDESLFIQAAKAGFLVKNTNGNDYLVDFGEFECGIVDFTNEKAFDWYKQIIKKNLIEFGLSGWMADFGEYLPTDCVLYSGESAMTGHNKWPGLWAKCNREAIEETGKLGELLFFMRAGNAMSSRYSMMMWAGDQNVDWSKDDGLPSVIPAALSAGMSGCGLHHSDIGGYTTLFTLKRSKELFQRWTEFAAFTVLMRTHEGNRPEKNVQFYTDVDTIKTVSRFSRIFVTLKLYRKAVIDEYETSGLPAMRPLFLHYENEKKTKKIQNEYLFGRDLLVAPIIKKGAKGRKVYLPKDNWINLWTGKKYTNLDKVTGTTILELAPIGYPPVYYREETKWEVLFKKVATIL